MLLDAPHLKRASLEFTVRARLGPGGSASRQALDSTGAGYL